MTWPALKEYDLRAWIRSQGRDLWTDKVSKFYQGYADIHASPQTIHIMVLRWLLWLPWYRRHVQRTLAHEWMHAHRRDEWHDPEPGDLRSTRIWNATTDKQGIMAASLAWRRTLPFPGAE